MKARLLENSNIEHTQAVNLSLHRIVNDVVEFYDYEHGFAAIDFVFRNENDDADYAAREVYKYIMVQVVDSGKMTESEMTLLAQNAIKVANNDNPTTTVVIQQILSELGTINPDEEYSDIELINEFAKTFTQKDEVVV